MQEVAQCTQVDEAQVPDGTASVSVQGSAGTSVSLAAPTLGTTTTRGGGIIVPQCTKHALSTYYATDHLGTVRFTKTIDDTGAVTTTTHDYEPFGVEITPTDECDNTHKFTGHERDTETQNDYMHARYYGSNLARFMKPDVIPGKQGDPQSWNLYAYVENNPTNRIDALGLDWFQIDGKWQWKKDKGSYTYTDKNGNQQTAKGYAYLMVVTLQSVDKNGVSHYSVNLYYQNEKKPVASGTAFSGGAPKKGGGQYSSIPDGNYMIKATSDMHHPAPTEQNPQSADNNPMPDYGIQPVPDSSSNGYLHAVWEAYGPMRARLNPMSPGMGDSFYFHGQQPDANHAGSTSGCLSYGTDDTVISAIWNTNSNVPVSIGTPVVMP
jgi:RHS repeat-associated protein